MKCDGGFDNSELDPGMHDLLTPVWLELYSEP